MIRIGAVLLGQAKNNQDDIGCGCRVHMCLMIKGTGRRPMLYNMCLIMSSHPLDHEDQVLKCRFLVYVTQHERELALQSYCVKQRS